MKYTPLQYAQSFLSALKNKPENEQKKMIGSFLYILKKNRNWHERGRIFREIEKQFLKESGIKKVSVETPSPVSKEMKKEIEKIFGGKIFWRERVKSDLCAGIRIEINDETLIDGTAKNRLKKLFSSI